MSTICDSRHSRLTGIEYVKSPLDRLACHDELRDIGVAAQSPVSDDDPAVNANTTDPEPSCGACDADRDVTPDPA